MTLELALYLAALAGLLALSGFFSGSETALFSLSTLQRKQIATGESLEDRRLWRLLRQPRLLIITLLLGNEIVNIITGSIVAMIVSAYLFPGASPINQALLGVAVAAPLLLLLGEVTPKTIAIGIPERWARRVSGQLTFFGGLVSPLRYVLLLIADGVIHLFGGRPVRRERPLLESEFLTLVDTSHRAGEIEAGEHQIIRNVFNFGDATVTQVMTPAERVTTVNVHDAPSEAVARVLQSRFSRVPVLRGSAGEVVGVLYAKDLVGYRDDETLQRAPLTDLLRPSMEVPADTTCARLFQAFRRRRIHLAIVVDAEGHMIGVASMEDLLEVLFGEILDEKEVPRPRRALEDG